MSTVELNANVQCPISFVTVFNDRAEITRDLTVPLESGKTEIVISGISRLMDQNTIRVVGAQGDATILEVSGNVSYLKKQTEKEKQQQELQKLQLDLARIKKQIARIQKENEWIDGWSKNMMKSPSNPTKSGEITVVDPFTSLNFEKTEQFLAFYQKRLEEVDIRLEEANAQHEEVQKLLTKKELEFGKVQSNGTGVHEILIVVYAKAPTKISLQIAYIVQSGSASWTASYDSRVSSGEQKLELNYYGNIINNSGEDWENVNVALSTAQPSVAGKPPELTTKIVRFKPRVTSRKWNSYEMSNSMVQKAMINPIYQEAVYDEDDYRGGESTAEVLTARSSESLTTTTFVIPRKSTIAADNKVHKVMIRSLPFNADFTYIAIPKLSLNTYLKASIQNKNKKVPLLPGPMNVFVDNNFVAKSDIPLINPNEALGIFLGIDAGIKIDYLPVKQLRDTQGIIAKTNKLNVKFQTNISNNKNKEIKLELFDNLPKSNDSSIKVKLHEPDIPETRTTTSASTATASSSVKSSDSWTGATITPANNIHWKMIIPADAKKQIDFEYTIEFPVDTDLENAF